MNQLIPEISATWFPLKENALATSVTLQMQGTGSIVSSILVRILFNHVKSMSTSKTNLHIQYSMWILGGLCIVVFFLVLLLFKERPKHPPSLVAANQHDACDKSFNNVFQVWKGLIRNVNYLILLLVFSLNYSVGMVFPTSLNNMITPFYDNAETKVAMLNLITIGFNTAGSILFSVVLDRYRKYKIQLLFHELP